MGWDSRALAATRGSALTTQTRSTVAGPTNGLEVSGHYISPPISADVTISGAITGNLWSSESSMSANVAINFVVDVIRATDNSIVEIVKSARVTEVATTTRAVNNFTATPGTGVVVNRGDRIRIRIFGDDAGTMASGFTFDLGYSGATADADGDSYVTFTETFAFESAPAGTTLYLTDTISDVATTAVDREAWTSRGAGVVNDVTNTAAGWTTPIQVTDTAGGAVVEWYTKQLQTFTLGGMARANIRALRSAANFASLKVEIARVDSDGTNPVVWGFWCRNVAEATQGNIATTETAYTVNVSGDDLAVSDGQRLRIRVFVDDCAEAALTSGITVTVFYNGTSAGASGDSYVILPQSVSEFSATPASLIYRPPPAVLRL
jgi:hypothetical protein